MIKLLIAYMLALPVMIATVIATVIWFIIWIPFVFFKDVMVQWRKKRCD